MLGTMLKRPRRHTPISTENEHPARGVTGFPRIAQLLALGGRPTIGRKGETTMDDYTRHVRLRAYLIWERGPTRRP